MAKRKPTVAQKNTKPEADSTKTTNTDADIITCMFCHKKHGNEIKMYEITTRSTDSDENHTYHACENCITHIQQFLSEITNTPLKNPVQDDPKPEDAFIGMLLKDFLCTATYINTSYDVIFYDYTGTEITEFTDFLKIPIYNIRKEDDTEKIHIMLTKAE